jgi:hypothetical protein
VPQVVKLDAAGVDTQLRPVANVRARAIGKDKKNVPVPRRVMQLILSKGIRAGFWHKKRTVGPPARCGYRNL